jgi:hypothetical protein
MSRLHLKISTHGWLGRLVVSERGVDLDTFLCDLDFLCHGCTQLLSLFFFSFGELLLSQANIHVSHVIPSHRTWRYNFVVFVYSLSYYIQFHGIYYGPYRILQLSNPKIKEKGGTRNVKPRPSLRFHRSQMRHPRFQFFCILPRAAAGAPSLPRSSTSMFCVRDLV